MEQIGNLKNMQLCCVKFNRQEPSQFRLSTEISRHRSSDWDNIGLSCRLNRLNKQSRWEEWQDKVSFCSLIRFNWRVPVRVSFVLARTLGPQSHSGRLLTHYRPREARNSIYRYWKIHIDYRSKFSYRFISSISIIYGNTNSFAVFKNCQALKNTNAYPNKVWDKSKTTWAVGIAQLTPLGPRWGQKSLDLRSRDFCPHLEQLGAAANFGDHTHRQIWGPNVNNNIYILTHENSSTGFE